MSSTCANRRHLHADSTFKPGTDLNIAQVLSKIAFLWRSRFARPGETPWRVREERSREHPDDRSRIAQDTRRSEAAQLLLSN